MDPVSVWLRNRRNKKNANIMKTHFQADGLGVKNKNFSFLEDERFEKPWAKAARLNQEGWSKTGRGVPDIRWRAHVCCWAAQNAMNLSGDFVECGVHTGLLSLTAADYVELNKSSKRLWLFDTFEGIPADLLSGSEKELAQKNNDNIYFDVYELAKRNFSEFKNAKLIKGRIPQSFSDVDIEQISYCSIDLNNALAEKEAIDFLWPKLVKGSIIVLDDYAFSGHETQYHMWNEFAASVGQMVLTLPTGQGLIISNNSGGSE